MAVGEEGVQKLTARAGTPRIMTHTFGQTAESRNCEHQNWMGTTFIGKL